jgi:hypothetical protein
MLKSQKSKNKKLPQKRKSKKPSITQSVFRGNARNTEHIPQSFLIASPSTITTLRYESVLANPINNAGSSFASVRFRPSSAFDVDPVLGGTVMPGFSTYATLYARYRMVKFKCVVTFVNLESFPVDVIVFPSNFDLGANYTQVQSQFSNSFARFKMLSPTGGMDRCVIHSPWLTAAKLNGDDGTMFDDSYASVVTTSPTNNTFINIAVWSGNSNTLNKGVATEITITTQYKFYEQFHDVTHPDPPQLHPELWSDQVITSIKK